VVLRGACVVQLLCGAPLLSTVAGHFTISSAPENPDSHDALALHSLADPQEYFTAAVVKRASETGSISAHFDVWAYKP
jgi:hypothetical protein